MIQELVAIDGADWHQEGGPTPFPSPPPVGVMVEMDRRSGATAFWLRNQVESYHQDQAELATALLQKLQASEAGQWVVASLHQQRVLVVSPNGDTCLTVFQGAAHPGET